jgi:hypothetical protein
MFLTTALLLGAMTLAGGANDSAASWSIDWSSVDGGGHRLSGGAFELHGTIGQADAGFHVELQGSIAYDLTGGFHAVQAFVGPLVLGDLNGDGVVGNIDLAILLGAWGSIGGPADLDGDGVVGNTDLAILLGAWSQ